MTGFTTRSRSLMVHMTHLWAAFLMFAAGSSSSRRIQQFIAIDTCILPMLNVIEPAIASSDYTACTQITEQWLPISARIHSPG